MSKPVAVFAVLGLLIAAGLSVYVFEPFKRHETVLGSTELNSDKPTALKVLFVGNSFTFYGPMPTIFGKLVLAGDPGRGVKIRMEALPSAKLVEHDKNGKVAHILAADGPWDYVVLQDQSRIAWTDPVAMRVGAKNLDALGRAAGARTVLFTTWADTKETDREQDMITGAYERTAAELGVAVAPVGRAWFATGPLRQKLYVQDGHHPSALGVYLTACVFYAMLVGKSPVGLPYPAEATEPASAADIATVQDVAARTTQTVGR